MPKKTESGGTSRLLRSRSDRLNTIGKAPPISISQPLHYDPAIYRAPGRTFYMSLQYSWE